MKSKLFVIILSMIISIPLFSEQDTDNQMRAQDASVHIYVYDNVTEDPVVGALVKCYEYWNTKAPTPKYIYEEETDENGHCKFLLYVTNYISYVFTAEKNNKFGSTGTYKAEELPDEIEIIISP